MSISEQDIQVFIAYLQKEISLDGAIEPEEFGYDQPAIICMDAVLSIRRKYNAFVVPRLQAFGEQYPDVKSLTALEKMIESLGEDRFCKAWNYNHLDRVHLLRRLIARFLDYINEHKFVDELEGMRHWAINTQPAAYKHFGVQGIGLATFQYLRMLLGAQTVKPDVHIKRAIFDALDKEVSGAKAIDLIEAVSKTLNVPATVLDHQIWKHFSAGNYE